MLLVHVLILIAVAATCVAASLNSIAGIYAVPSARRGLWVTDRLALVLLGMFLTMMMFRSRQFGADTASYSETFSAYCLHPSANGLDAEVLLSIKLLNIAMLGACDEALLPAAWALLITASIFASYARLSFKTRYGALLLHSLIGVELTTNALRQGLATSLLIVSISLYRRSRVAAAVLAAGAVTLHASAMLVVLACILGALHWKWFIAGSAGLIGLTVAGLDTDAGIEFGPLQRFLYETRKYLSHEGDEIWIRVLSFSALILCLAAPLLCAGTRRQVRTLIRDDRWRYALKVTLTCLPFLLLPYFGYRYVYGVFPVVLWMISSVASREPALSARVFACIFASNLAVLLVWAGGSSYMQAVPFFE